MDPGFRPFGPDSVNPYENGFGTNLEGFDCGVFSAFDLAFSSSATLYLVASSKKEGCIGLVGLIICSIYQFMRFSHVVNIISLGSSTL